jgi:hypothetical protein
MGAPFKTGDVAVVVDIRERVEREGDALNQAPEGFTDYQRTHKGTKTVLLNKDMLNDYFDSE